MPFSKTTCAPLPSTLDVLASTCLMRISMSFTPTDIHTRTLTQFNPRFGTLSLKSSWKKPMKLRNSVYFVFALIQVYLGITESIGRWHCFSQSNFIWVPFTLVKIRKKNLHHTPTDKMSRKCSFLTLLPPNSYAWSDLMHKFLMFSFQFIFYKQSDTNRKMLKNFDKVAMYSGGISLSGCLSDKAC